MTDANDVNDDEDEGLDPIDRQDGTYGCPRCGMVLFASITELAAWFICSSCRWEKDEKLGMKEESGPQV